MVMVLFSRLRVTFIPRILDTSSMSNILNRFISCFLRSFSRDLLALRNIMSSMLLLLLLFLTFSVLVANPKKLLYTVANPGRGLLNREKRTK